MRKFIYLLSAAFLANCVLFGQEAKNESVSVDILAKTGYNSDAENAKKAEVVDGGLAYLACVGCHNGKATYSVISKDGEAAFKLKYYAVAKKGDSSEFSSLNKEFDLSEKDANTLIELMQGEISKAKEDSKHLEGDKRGSSFEFAVKDGQEWQRAGHYSKGSYTLAKSISSLLKAKNQDDVNAKLRQINAK